jgi:hypothetical protein
MFSLIGRGEDKKAYMVFAVSDSRKIFKLLVHTAFRRDTKDWGHPLGCLLVRMRDEFSKHRGITNEESQSNR